MRIKLRLKEFVERNIPLGPRKLESHVEPCPQEGLSPRHCWHTEIVFQCSRDPYSEGWHSDDFQALQTLPLND